MAPIIESWHGYKATATTAEVVITGSGFGTDVGSVKLKPQGAGNTRPVIYIWTDTLIVCEAPIDSTILEGVLVKPRTGTGQKEKASTKKLPGGASLPSADTNDSTASWSGVTFADSEDEITISGTGLSAVEQVILFDDDVPGAIYDSPFSYDAGDLSVEWPAAFSGNIERVRLIGNSGTEKSEHFVNLEPAPDALVENCVGGLNGTQAVVNITGLGFGALQGSGTVSLRVQGGATTQRIVNSWSDTSIQVQADLATVYDQVIVTIDGGATAAIAAGHPATFSTPGTIYNLSDPTFTDESVVGTAKVRIRFTGNNLLLLGYAKLYASAAIPFGDRGGVDGILNPLRPGYTGQIPGCTLVEWTDTAIEAVCEPGAFPSWYAGKKVDSYSILANDGVNTTYGTFPVYTLPVAL